MPALATLPSEGAYVIRRPMTVEGHRYQPGALLPVDAVVRKNTRRLEMLYRGRFIQPAPTVASATNSSVPVKDLSFLTKDELVFLCKNRDLSIRGSDDALRQRLATALE